MPDDARPGPIPGLTWNGAAPPELPAPAPWQWPAAALRALLLVLATYLLSVPVQILKRAERGRPDGRWYGIVRLWGRINLRLCGVRLRRTGRPMTEGGAMVSNHTGWIDIFTLLAADRLFFVSKSEVADWPVVGVLSRQMDPVYIERRRTASKAQEAELRRRLLRGDRLCFFPEGTSTDGRRVLPFRSSLFAAFMDPALRETLRVQPVSLVYRPPAGLPESFYGWWGDMSLAAHLRAVFTLSWGGEVEVVFHPPVRVGDFEDRKALARHCETAVRDGVAARVGEAAAG